MSIEDDQDSMRLVIEKADTALKVLAAVCIEIKALVPEGQRDCIEAHLQAANKALGLSILDESAPVEQDKIVCPGPGCLGCGTPDCQSAESVEPQAKASDILAEAKRMADGYAETKNVSYTCKHKAEALYEFIDRFAGVEPQVEVPQGEDYFAELVRVADNCTDLVAQDWLKDTGQRLFELVRLVGAQLPDALDYLDAMDDCQIDHDAHTLLLAIAPRLRAVTDFADSIGGGE